MTTDPITLARHATPWWMNRIKEFDGLEIHPVRTHPAGDDDKTYCEICDRADEAEFWSVYGHRAEGHVECFEDFPSKKLAIQFADQLLRAYPHLEKYDLWVG